MIFTPLRTLTLITCLLALSGCSQEEMVPVGVTGYNHIEDQSIDYFTVNGAGGSLLPPWSGGGNTSCCVSIPEKWKPGMTATVHWSYGKRQGQPPPPEPQSATVEIPEYAPKKIGNLHVHFYPDHQIKVVVTTYGLGHSYYPLPKADWAPWELDEAVVRNLKWLEEQRAKGNIK